MIINLTQHPASAEQIAADVLDLPAAERGDLTRLLTVDELPTAEEIGARCHDIALLAVHNGLGGDDSGDPLPLRAMIGGAPWMMRALEDALIAAGVEPVYSFTRRESSEVVLPDGGVRKTAVFRHIGWVSSGG